MKKMKKEKKNKKKMEKQKNKRKNKGKELKDASTMLEHFPLCITQYVLHEEQ